MRTDVLTVVASLRSTPAANDELALFLAEQAVPARQTTPAVLAQTGVDDVRPARARTLLPSGVRARVNRTRLRVRTAAVATVAALAQAGFGAKVALAAAVTATGVAAAGATGVVPVPKVIPVLQQSRSQTSVTTPATNSSKVATVVHATPTDAASPQASARPAPATAGHPTPTGAPSAGSVVPDPIVLDPAADRASARAERRAAVESQRPSDGGAERSGQRPGEPTQPQGSQPKQRGLGSGHGADPSARDADPEQAGTAGGMAPAAGVGGQRGRSAEAGDVPVRRSGR